MVEIAIETIINSASTSFILLIMLIILILLAAVYVYSALVLMTIAKKTNTENPWLAWIPIANIYLMTKIAKVPWWTLLIVVASPFIPFIGLIGVLVAWGITIWFWWRIAEARGKPGWIALLMLIPLVNLIIMGIIAWSNGQTSARKR